MFFQHFVADTGAVIKAVNKGIGIKLHEIDIARPVLCEQNQMIGTLIDVVLRVVFHNVKFATDDCFNIFLLALFGKTKRCVHIAVIGQCNRIDMIFHAVIN